MSNIHNERWLEAAKDNFDEAISKHDWAQAHAVCDDTAANGFEIEAQELRRELNRAQAFYLEEQEKADDEFTYETRGDEEIPPITPEEDDAPAPGQASRADRAAFFGVSEESLEQMELKEEDHA